jgi:hypothetical protein
VAPPRASHTPSSWYADSADDDFALTDPRLANLLKRKRRLSDQQQVREVSMSMMMIIMIMIMILPLLALPTMTKIAF